MRTGTGVAEKRPRPHESGTDNLNLAETLRKAENKAEALPDSMQLVAEATH